MEGQGGECPKHMDQLSELGIGLQQWCHTFASYTSQANMLSSLIASPSMEQSHSTLLLPRRTQVVNRKPDLVAPLTPVVLQV